MARNSGGTYSAPSNSFNPAVSGTVIDEVDWNETLTDLESAITESLYTAATSAVDNALVVADGTSGVKTQTLSVTMTEGTAVPTAAQPKGSVYIKTNASNGATRAYIATSATGAWSPLVTAESVAGFAVSAYGATGDGTTDDRAAIAAADTAAQAVGGNGGTVVFYAGTFLVGTNLTISSNVMFRGGRIKPASGVTVTLSGVIDANPEQIFDLSAGGGAVIAGSGELVDGSVWAEWWGAVGNGSTDCATAVGQAIAFLKQRTLAGVLGGRLRFGIGKFVMSSGVTIDFSGCRIEGTGEHTTRITHNFNGDLFTFSGTVAGGDAAYGSEIRDIGIDHSTATPTAGSTIKFYRCKDFVVDNVTIVNHFVAIHLQGCEGTEISYINNCHIVSPSSGTAQTGSACIYLEGNATGATTGLNETIMVTNVRGGGTKTEYGVRIQAADVVTFTGVHFWGATVATLHIDGNDSYAIYNIKSQGSVWEGIASVAPYAILADSGTENVDAIQFVGDQLLNGTTAMARIDGANIHGLQFVGCYFKQAPADALIFEAGESLSAVGCTFTDANTANSGTRYYIIIGDGSTGPTDVVISGCQCHAYDSANTVAGGIYLQNGTGVALSGNIFRDVTAPIVAGSATLVGNGSEALSNGANSDIDIGADAEWIEITGPSAAFSTTGFTPAWPGREITVYNTVAQDWTITNDATSTAANRILTLTGSDVTLTGVSAASFRYSATSSRWILTGTQG